MSRAIIRSQLAPTGVLRAAINMSNFLLVTGERDGSPVGVSPDMARLLASKLDVGIQLIAYQGPGFLADANSEWDIGNIANEPERAKVIHFSPAYCEIEATYMLPPGSEIQTIGEVDRRQHRIVAKHRAAYDLWLQDNIEHASIVNTETIDESFEEFVDKNYEVLAGLRPKLLEQQAQLPGSTIIDGNFTAIKQSMGIQHELPEAAEFMYSFVEEAKSSGFVEELIHKHGVVGRLSVAPPEQKSWPVEKGRPPQMSVKRI